MESSFQGDATKHTKRLALAGIVLLLVGLQLTAQSPRGSQTVDLSLVATDHRGQPVSDLASSEIRITDDGKPQQLLFLRRIDRRRPEPAKLETGEFSNRKGSVIPHATVVLLDFLNERFTTRAIAANNLAHYLESLESADYLYLYFLTMDGRIMPVQGLHDEDAEAGAAANSDGQRPDLWTRHAKTLIEAANRQAIQVRPSNLDVGTRIDLTYQGLNTLGAVLSRVPGRKNIVWITDGVPLELGPVHSGTGQTVDFGPMARQLSLAFERSQMAIYPVQQITIGSPNALPDVPGSEEGRSVGAGLGSRETLELFAKVTGGREDLGKDIGAAIGQAMNDARWSYRAGYAPPPENWDRKYHKIRITCTRKGVHIQAKSGYYAWPEDRSFRMKDAMREIAAAPFDAAEIGLRGDMEHMAGGVLRIRLRIDAGDIITIPDGDRQIARLNLSVLTWSQNGLQPGQTTPSPITPIDFRWTDADLTKAISEGIILDQRLRPDSAATALRVVIRDDNGGAAGSLTLPTQQKSAR